MEKTCDIRQHYEEKHKERIDKKNLFKKEINKFISDLRVKESDVFLLIKKNQDHLIAEKIFEKYSENLSNKALKKIILEINNEKIKIKTLDYCLKWERLSYFDYLKIASASNNLDLWTKAINKVIEFIYNKESFEDIHCHTFLNKDVKNVLTEYWKSKWYLEKNYWNLKDKEKEKIENIKNYYRNLFKKI